MCMEFWCGWFDHWYEEHHVREAEELAGLAKIVNSGEDSFQGKTVKLGSDINFANKDVTPVNTFKGTVDGKGYTLSNAKIGDGTASHQAFFPMLAGTMGVFLMKQYMEGSIPDALLEAARIDGASRFRTFYKVILPLSKSIIIYTILISFIAPWCDYIFVSYIMAGVPDTGMYTVSLGMYKWLEREMIQQIPFSEEAYCQAIDVDTTFGEEGYSTLERNSCRPSFDICGIWGGYTGEGSKTVLPSKAYAKVSCRLVANQDHEQISQAFVDYIIGIAPAGVRVKVTPMHGGQGYVCPIDIPAYKAAEHGFEVAFGKKPLAARRGGSIPIISSFEQILGVKTILMGFGLEKNAIHSPNESMDLEVWENGIVAVTEFYKALTHNS